MPAPPTLHAVVFSLNRAILCDHLLRSMKERFLHEPGSVRITVLYGATTPEYEAGYEILKRRFAADEVEFIRKYQGTYRTPARLLVRPRNAFYYLTKPYYRDISRIFNFRELLQTLLVESTAACATFLTDDSWFYRATTWSPDIAERIAERPSQVSFSFRHGLNISQGVRGILESGGYIWWSYSDPDHSGHWSYRFSIDGHVYDRRHLVAFTDRILYINPNTFEGVVGRYAQLARRLQDGFAYPESSLVGAELNRVQTVAANNDSGIDNGMLNDYFLRGYALDIQIAGEVLDFRPPLAKIAVYRQATGEAVDVIAAL